MSQLTPTSRTRLKRRPERGHYDRETIRAILDEGLVCHVAVPVDGRPHVIPTAYVRVGDWIYLHGATANQLLRALRSGAEAGLCVTLIDGLVLARSAFHSSVNYRSVVVYGRATEVVDPNEKLEALHALVDHMVPGRWSDVRAPNPYELRQTLVVKLPIEEASAKLRAGPPSDDEPDYALDCWAGVIPLGLEVGKPQADPRLDPAVEPPDYARAYRRPAP